jgi:hypothetical protein
MYPVDFNPNQLAHPPKPGIKATFIDNPEIRDRQIPKNDAMQIEPNNPQYMGGKMMQERAFPIHSETEAHLAAYPTFLPMGVKLSETGYAENAGQLDQYEYEINNPHSKETRLRDDRSYHEGPEELEADYQNQTGPFPRHVTIRDREHSNGPDEIEYQGEPAQNRPKTAGTRLKEDREYKDGTNQFEYEAPPYNNNNNGQRSITLRDRENQDQRDNRNLEYQTCLNGQNQRSLSLKEWKLSNANQGHTEQEYVNR